MSEGNTPLYPITTQPGVKKDGSRLAGNYYIDSQWCRYIRGVPRKIGGYKLLAQTSKIVRDLFVLPTTPNFNVYICDSDRIRYFAIDQFGNTAGVIVDRTPVGFLTNPDNIWQFTSLFVTTNNDDTLIAHAAPNLSYIDSTVETPVYYGISTQSTPLTPTGFSVSGGIVCLNPYLVMFGNYGQVIISQANNPTVELFRARVTSQKIVCGMPVRGGTNSPSGLLWSLNSLIRMTTATVNNTPTFSFDTISSESSILSSSSVIEYDGKFFWAGIDRFLAYNGTVLEIPNDKNLLWFYQNLNYQYRQKVWATKNPEFGEIWWWFPFGDSTECNQAVIFNVREGTWYNTAMDADIPTIGRASGYFEQVFSQPIWADLNGDVWLHEEGYNEDHGNVQIAIKSYFETGDISFCAVGPLGNWEGKNRWTSLEWIEPDFWQQNGDITLTVRGQEFPNSPIVNAGTFTLTPATTFQDIRIQQRFMTLKFESDVIDGFYELGQTLLAINPGDARE